MTQKQYYNDLVKKMTALGVYKPEFQHAITGLARALCDQDTMMDKFALSGGQIIVKHTNKSGATNAAKNPFYLAIETLRQDILQYSRELGLTPASLKKINEVEMKSKKESSFSMMLRDIGQ
jgi:phage terminase small subunit